MNNSCGFFTNSVICTRKHTALGPRPGDVPRRPVPCMAASQPDFAGSTCGGRSLHTGGWGAPSDVAACAATKPSATCAQRGVRGVGKGDTAYRRSRAPASRVTAGAHKDSTCGPFCSRQRHGAVIRSAPRAPPAPCIRADPLPAAQVPKAP